MVRVYQWLECHYIKSMTKYWLILNGSPELVIKWALFPKGNVIINILKLLGILFDKKLLTKLESNWWTCRNSRNDFAWNNFYKDYFLRVKILRNYYAVFRSPSPIHYQVFTWPMCELCPAELLWYSIFCWWLRNIWVTQFDEVPLL